MKKMPRKGKDWIEKDAQMGKDCDEKDEKWFIYYYSYYLDNLTNYQLFVIVENWYHV